jgi:(R,R)-butanediol dehydrogenase/meso-butanediol dehydrogenase/diacetyl reductase
MRAAVWRGQRNIVVEDVAEPDDPHDSEVVVEVLRAGICGTDIHEYLAGPTFIPPTVSRVVLGHEFSATVAVVGEAVTGFCPGDRVAVVPHQSCGRCVFCRRGMLQHCQNLQLVGLSLDGAFTRFVRVREHQLVHLPESVSDEAGALVEPLAVALRALRLPGVRIGDDAVVIGAGPIGLCTIAAARALGLRRVIVVEKMPRRAALAARLGADRVIDPRETDARQEVRDLTAGRGVDVALECVGHIETMNLAIDVVRPGGVAIVIGIGETSGGLNLDAAVVQEKEIRGCIGYFEGEWQTVVDLIASGRLDPSPLVTRTVDIEDIVTHGFEAIVGDRDECVKVLVRPGIATAREQRADR